MMQGSFPVPCYFVQALSIMHNVSWNHEITDPPITSKSKCSQTFGAQVAAAFCHLQSVYHSACKTPGGNWCRQVSHYVVLVCQGLVVFPSDKADDYAAEFHDAMIIDCDQQCHYILHADSYTERRFAQPIIRDKHSSSTPCM